MFLINQRGRGIVTSFFMLCLLLSSISWFTPIATAQETPPPATAESTAEPTTPAMATMEPTNPPAVATRQPTNPPAATLEPTIPPASTLEPTVEPTATAEVPTSTAVATATDEPEFEAAVLVSGFYVQFSVCGDAARSGTTDYFFVAAAGNATDCRFTNLVSGAPVTATLTDVSGVNGPYTFPFDANGNLQVIEAIEVGSYTISLTNGVDFNSTGPMVMELTQYSASILTIVTYIDPVPDVPGTDPGVGSMYGTFLTCIDADRANTIDLFITDYMVAAEPCAYRYDGRGGFLLSGTTLEGDTFEQRGSQNIGFSSVPFGTYTIADLASGAVSDPFVFDSAYFGVNVVSYYESQPVFLPTVNVQKTFCEDDSRVGETSFILTATFEDDQPAPVASSTCTVVPGADIAPAITVSLDSVTSSMTREITSTLYPFLFSPLDPGSYTVTQVTGSGAGSVSDSFELVYGQQQLVQIITYVASTPPSNPGTGDSTVYVFGSLNICTSDDRAGEIDFVMSIQEFSATATSECIAADASTGQITAYGYGTGTEPTAQPTTSYPVFRYGEEGDFGIGGDATPGWYQFGFAPSGLDAAVLSEVIWAGSDEDFVYLQVAIYAYVEAVPTATVYVDPYRCFNPERAGETDFLMLVQSASAEAVSCELSREGTFWLTDTTTMQTVNSSPPQFEGSYTHPLNGVPDGTYTLSQELNGVVTTSDPFEVTIANGITRVDVRNYTSEEIEPYPDNGRTFPFLTAFQCIDAMGERVVGYAWFADFGIPVSDPFATGFSASANTTATCEVEERGAYTFELRTVTNSDVSAAAFYPLVEDEEFAGLYHLPGSEDESIPTGTYVLYDLNSGWSSAPMDFTAEYNRIEFYGIEGAGGTVEPGEGGGQTPTPGNEDPGTGNEDPGTGSETPATGGVTQLPSTGSAPANPTYTVALMLLVAVLFLGGALRFRRIN